jgi:hypothetical protein
MISNEVSPRRVHLGLAVLVGLGLSALSLPALAGVGLGDDGAVAATEAEAPLVVADNQGLKNNRTWSPNSYNNSRKIGTRIGTRTGTATGTITPIGTRNTRTKTGTRIRSMFGPGSTSLITASSSAASFSARS